MPSNRLTVSSRALRVPFTTAVLFGLVGGLTRLPFVRSTPANWDAVQFALALDRFDLHLHQPHPPGYLLYVLMGRALNLVIGEPGVALALLSVLSAAVAASLCYLLGREVFEDDNMGIGATLLFLGSPLTFYYGAAGLSYMPEMALAMAVGLVAWRAREREGSGVRNAAALGVCLGLAAGVRQSSIVVLLPLCLWGVWKTGRPGWAAFAFSAVPVTFAWAVPLIAMSGGPEAYLRESALLGESVSQRTSIISAGAGGLFYNVSLEAMTLALGLAFGLVPFGLWAARVARFTLSGRLKGFLAVWALPGVLFFAVSHLGQWGYMLAVLPPFLLLAALCARVAWLRLDDTKGRANRWPVACFALAFGSALYFVVVGGPTVDSSLDANDRHWKALEGYLGRVDARSTALVMDITWDGPFRHAGYLLPEFHAYAAGKSDTGGGFGWLHSAYGGRSTYSLPDPPARAGLDLPPDTRRVIALDTKMGERMAGSEAVERVALEDGSSLYILERPGSGIRRLEITDQSLTAR